MRFGSQYSWVSLLAGISAGAPAVAQDRLNQADPSIIERALPAPKQPAAEDAAPVDTARPAIPDASAAAPRVASAIIVEGAAEIPRAAFASALTPYLGRNLSAGDLSALARAVADIARQNGYPFASAWIEPQAMERGLLRVRLDAGTVSAVRVIGAINPAADRILTHALAGDRPVRREQLERAILLVGDLPGVTVKGSKFMRQDGFGILLVTIAEDKASAYAQIDNRGSKEIGPIRLTALGNVRSVIGAGDEVSLIGAKTPFDWPEFGFVRGRYTAPIDADGASLSASASYGRTHPGASLAGLDVIGKSLDAVASYTKPVKRSRAASVWATVEFRGLSSNQSLLGSALRRDRLALLTGSLTATVRAGDGTVRLQANMIGGLPVGGVTREGDPLSSRPDGDARFVVWSYAAEWVAPLGGKTSLALASEGQMASRPLLAPVEIGVGGPAYGRGYDYAERTGDSGVTGSAELRVDAGAWRPAPLDRLQFYASVDGGHVANLREGRGGGSLLSAGGGLRAGLGRTSGMVEIGVPLNHVRFDTGDRRPRLSFRLARAF